MTNITYIDWDYKSMIAVRYNRTGECNRCGDCCRRRINITMVEGGDKNTHGGDTTDEDGRWSEIETGDKREFIRFWDTDDPEHKPCDALYKNDCSLNGYKPWCCTVWPTAPSDIKSFPNCSYVFAETRRWTFDG